MSPFSEHRLVHFENPEPPVPQVQKAEKERQEQANKDATIETPAQHHETLQKVLAASFHLPADVTIGNADVQPRGANAFAGIWHRGNFVGTLISNTNTFSDPTRINTDLRLMFEQANITLNYFSTNITPEAQKRMAQDQISIQSGPGQHFLMIAGRRLGRIDYRTPSVNARLVGQNLVIDINTVGDNGDSLTFLPGNFDPVLGVLPPVPSPAEAAKKLKEQSAKNAKIEEQEKKDTEQQMDKKLAAMDQGEDHNLNLQGLAIRTNDVVLRYPNGERSILRPGRDGYQTVPPTRRTWEDINEVRQFVTDNNARYRIIRAADMPER